jgi:putative transcriptional regulator
MRNFLIATLFALMAAWTASAAAAELSRPLALVATPGLMDPIYGRSVLVVKPFGRDQHLGFIVNRPTDFTLGKIFPEHGPSQKVVDPVFLGGPVQASAIFALVAQPESPGGNSIEIMPGLFAAHDAAIVDKIIEAKPDDARFVAGLVLWRPGELRQEIEMGAWHVIDSNPQLALRKPDGLWEELVKGAERSRHLLRTRLLH